MAMTYAVVGYDRETEWLVERHDVPSRFVAHAKRIAGLDPDDGRIIGDWPLTAAQVAHIAAVLGVRLRPDVLDYMLEPYALSTVEP